MGKMRLETSFLTKFAIIIVTNNGNLDAGERRRGTKGI